MISALNGIGNGAGLGTPLLAASPKPIGNAGSSPFGELLRSSIENINELEQEARTAVNGLIAGSGVDVHRAMIAAEKASMGFELALAVRNKAIQSYQSVMSMQF